MKYSTAQKMRLGLAVFFFLFLIFWILFPGSTLLKVLGISSSACLVLAMLLSFFHEKKQNEK